MPPIRGAYTNVVESRKQNLVPETRHLQDNRDEAYTQMDASMCSSNNMASRKAVGGTSAHTLPIG